MENIGESITRRGGAERVPHLSYTLHYIMPCVNHTFLKSYFFSIGELGIGSKLGHRTDDWCKMGRRGKAVLLFELAQVYNFHSGFGGGNGNLKHFTCRGAVGYKLRSILQAELAGEL